MARVLRAAGTAAGFALLAACSAPAHAALSPSQAATSTTTPGSEPGSGSSSSTAVAAPTTTSAPTTTTAAPPRFPSAPVAPIGPTGGVAPVVSRVDTDDPVVFLTIDDGQVRDPRVPALLAEHDVPVTLFLNEAPLRADPAYFQQFVDMGASVNSHTLDHPDLATLGPSAQQREICGMADVVDEVLVPHGHLFRPPFGSYDGTTRAAAATCGMNVVVTWRAALNSGMVQLQEGTELRPGDIILSHFRDDLYDNLQELLRVVEAEGLTLARLDDYLPAP